MTSKVGLAAFLILASCGSPPPQETTPTASTEPPEADDQTTATPEAQPTPPSPPPGPAPTLAIVGTPASIGRTVAISITNRGATEASLRSTLELEIERNGAFVATESPTTLSLRYDCQHEAPTCVTLGTGAELLPPEWLGTWGDVQCVCTRCGPAEAGTYRFVATTCDGAHRIEGTPFTVER